MGKRERDKGLLGEREVAQIMRAGGAEVRNLDGQGDHLVVREQEEGGPDLHIEVKRQERIEIERWCRQAEAEVPAGAVAVVAWRRSRQPWRVTLTLDDFMRLLG